MAALACLALAQANIAARDPSSSAQRILVAIDPLYAINWSSSVLCVIGSNEINSLCRLRSSRLGRDSYVKIAAHLTRSLIQPDMITPREWGIWSSLINQYNLYENAPLYDWAALTTDLQRPRIWNPADLCSFHKEEIFALDDGLAAHGRYIILWQAAKSQFEDKSPSVLPRRMDLINKDIDSLLLNFQQANISDAKIYKEY